MRAVLLQGRKKRAKIMNEPIDYLLQEIQGLEKRVAELESERGPVRSDGLVAPSFASDETDTQDRPHCAGQGALKLTDCEQPEYRDLVAAKWSDEKFVSEIPTLVAYMEDCGALFFAAQLAAFNDRFKERTAVVSEP